MIEWQKKYEYILYLNNRLIKMIQLNPKKNTHHSQTLNFSKTQFQNTEVGNSKVNQW